MQAPACRTGERQTSRVKLAGGDIAGGGKREASVANDSVMDRSKADGVLLVNADEKMYALSWDSKPFGRCAWRSDLLWVL